MWSYLETGEARQHVANFKGVLSSYSYNKTN